MSQKSARAPGLLETKKASKDSTAGKKVEVPESKKAAKEDEPKMNLNSALQDNGLAKDTNPKDVKAKDTNGKDAKVKDMNTKDVKAKDTHAKDSKAKDTNSKDAKAKDTNAKEVKAKASEKQNGDRPSVSSGKPTNAAQTNGKADGSSGSKKTENGVMNISQKDTVDLTNDEEENLVVIMDQENDEIFPELRFEENSDAEGNFESSTPDHAASGRSLTRRSQVKQVHTPETPKPVGNGKASSVQSEVIVEEAEPQVATSDGPAENNEPGVNDMAMQAIVKVLKLKDGPLTGGSPMKLRSADSPVPPSEESSKEDRETAEEQTDQSKKSDSGQGKSDTNFSKSRIKVSPYRKSMRKSEQTTTLLAATSTTSTIESPSPSTSQTEEQLSSEGGSPGLILDRSVTDFRSIKGRRSYKQLREISLRNLSIQRQRREALKDQEDMETSNEDSINATTGSDLASVSTLDSTSSKSRYTPVGTVIGRKRRLSPERRDITVEAYVESIDLEPVHAAKRSRFIDRVSERVSAGVTPLRKFLSRGYTVTSSTPVQFPEEYRDVAEAEYMSIVPPSEPSESPTEQEFSPVETVAAEKIESNLAESTRPAIAVQPNRRCAIM